MLFSRPAVASCAGLLAWFSLPLSAQTMPFDPGNAPWEPVPPFSRTAGQPRALPPTLPLPAGPLGADAPALASVDALLFTFTDADSLEAVRDADLLVDDLVAEGVLVATGPPVVDPNLPAHSHQSFIQYHDGVRVQGGHLNRQTRDGVTVSLFGTVHQGIDLDVEPRLSRLEARESLGLAMPAAQASMEPDPVILWSDLHGYSLTWAVHSGAAVSYVDAHDGSLLSTESLVRHQDAVASGRGIVGQRKKLATTFAAGSYRARDRLRPAETITLDLRYDTERADSIIDAEAPARWLESDVAASADPEFADAAVVDGHAYAGFFYDWLATRHGRRGYDNRDGTLFSIVNFARDYNNAFWCRPPCGPAKTGVVAFGENDLGVPQVSLDTVAHEIMHGVTHFAVSSRAGPDARLGPGHTYVTSGGNLVVFELDGERDRYRIDCGRLYRYVEVDGWWLSGLQFRYGCDQPNSRGRPVLVAAEGVAANEAYSDIAGAALEFFAHSDTAPAGSLQPDYTLGEDSGDVIRSSSDPSGFKLIDGGRLNVPLRYPTSYDRLVRFTVHVVLFEDEWYLVYGDEVSVDGGRSLHFTASPGYAGEHWNSTILSHAFYRAVEWDHHLQGRGFAPHGPDSLRQDVEHVFMRALFRLMPANSDYRRIAAAIRQSASDLHGRSSTVYESVDIALRAVGL